MSAQHFHKSNFILKRVSKRMSNNIGIHYQLNRTKSSIPMNQKWWGNRHFLKWRRIESTSDGKIKCYITIIRKNLIRWQLVVARVTTLYRAAARYFSLLAMKTVRISISNWLWVRWTHPNLSRRKEKFSNKGVSQVSRVVIKSRWKVASRF